MRISSAQIFNIANRGMREASQAVTHTQEQLSTGLRVLNPSDDPVAATKIMQLSTEVSNIEQFEKNIDIARNNLVLEEVALDTVLNLMQRMQELAVQAGNTATLSESEYDTLASEVDARLDELTNILNGQNANGDYIFGGYKSTTPPFVGSAFSGFDYVGDDGQQYIKIANNTTIASSDSGKSLFVDVVSSQNTVATSASTANRSDPPVSISMGLVVDQEAYDDFYPEDMIITFNADVDLTPALPAGKNYTITERSTGRVIADTVPYSANTPIVANGVTFVITGTPASAIPATAGTPPTPEIPGDRLFVDSTEKQNVLTSLARFSTAMKAYDGSQEAKDGLGVVVASALDDFKNVQTSILDVVSQLGARFNTLESTGELHLDSTLIMKDVLAQLRDVDYAEAATQLAAESMVLQAAQATFVRVSQLTLFSRL